MIVRCNLLLDDQLQTNFRCFTGPRRSSRRTRECSKITDPASAQGRVTAEHSQAHRVAMMLATAKPGVPSEACIPYSGSTPPEAYSRPDHKTEQPSRAAAVQGWRAAPPEGLVLDWREHDGSIGRLGGPDGATHTRLPQGKSRRRVAGGMSGSAGGVTSVRSPFPKDPCCAPAAARARRPRARRL